MRKKAQTSEENLLFCADKIIDLCQRNDIKKFDGFMPIIPDMYDEEYGIFTDVKPTDLAMKSIDISLLVLGIEDGYKQKRFSQFARLKYLTPQELRKRTGIFAINPYLIEVAFENLKDQADGFVQFVGGKMKYLEIPNYQTSKDAKEEALQTVQTLLGIQWNLENQSYVYLKPDNSSIGFKYPIDSLSQLKELFSLRDVPDGKKRRVMLRNWVAKHMRRKPSNPDELVEVRKHLRGREDFKWFGMSGSIYVNS